MAKHWLCLIVFASNLIAFQNTIFVMVTYWRHLAIIQQYDNVATSISVPLLKIHRNTLLNEDFC